MPRKATGASYHWDPDKERVLLEKLECHVAANNGKFPPLDTFELWAQEFNSAFGGVPAYGITLQQKKDRMKKIYRGWKALQCLTGLGYDPMTDRVICSDETWQSFVKVINTLCYNCLRVFCFSYISYYSATHLTDINPLQVNKECNHLRHEGLRHKELYYNVFEKKHAAGASGYASVSMADATQPTVDIDATQDYSGIGPISDQDLTPPSGNRRLAGGGPMRSRGSSGKRKNRDETDEMTFRAMQELVSHYRGRSDSGTSRSHSSRTDHMLLCMSAMTEMGIPPNQWTKMWHYFLTRPQLQRTFHKLPEVDRREIVASVVQSPPPPTD